MCAWANRGCMLVVQSFNRMTTMSIEVVSTCPIDVWWERRKAPHACLLASRSHHGSSSVQNVLLSYKILWQPKKCECDYRWMGHPVSELAPGIRGGIRGMMSQRLC